MKKTNKESQPDYKELWQRALAEQENSRKRLEQDRQSFTKYALEGVMEELLPVIDNFYRATEFIPEDQRSAGWVTGVLHIQKQLLDTLERRGLQEIPVKKGDKFNPHQHEAISSDADASVPDDHIIEVKNKGYLLNDRVLRPSQVVVSHQSKE